MTDRPQVGGDHYLVRYARKGTPRQDLLKARQYIDFLLERHPE